MHGLFLFALMACWLYFCIWVSVKIGIRIPSRAGRWLVVPLLIAALVVGPVVDELVGSYQFKKLCQQYASTITLDSKSARGRTVYYASQPRVEVDGTWVPVYLRRIRFVDATNGETVVTYNELGAVGGWLARRGVISEGRVPLLFRGTCVPPERPGSIETFAPYGINYIEPPKTGSTK